MADTGWLTERQFAVGIGLAYATPGPVLILAAFVGYSVHGFPVPRLLATFTRSSPSRSCSPGWRHSL